MKILDLYIIKRFLGTFAFMTSLLALIVVIIDLSQKISKIEENGSTIWEALTMYYPFYLVWIINTFLAIGIFISAIYFTSRITNNTEVVAMTSGGMSFLRFTRPYLIVAIGVGLTSFLVNHYFLPKANIYKNEYMYKYLQRSSDEFEYFKGRPISSQISPNEYLFVYNYDRRTKNGNGFLYQKFEDLELVHSIRANSLLWDEEKKIYKLNNYYERYARENQADSIIQGNLLEQKLKFSPDELLPEGYVAETMNSFDLIKFIEREKFKGSASINVYKNELYQRSSLPFSSIILTLLAISLSTTKRRGGLGINLAIGISIAFIYIFGNEASKVIASVGNMDPLLATWLSNIVFGLLTIVLYIKRVLK